MKILGVGWAKTGTTSLGSALDLLGFKHHSQDFELAKSLQQNRINEVLAVADRYQSFEDWPWLLLYREFDARYPHCQFILTHREPRKWIASYRKQLDRAPRSDDLDRLRDYLFGFHVRSASDDQLIERYLRHNADVCAYFSGQPNKLLKLDITSGDGWSELCAFLSVPVPDLEFPRANVAPEISKLARLRHKVKAWSLRTASGQK
ncbi:MAG: sulfotransferase family protein [Pseudomonadota bacterium]